MIVGVPAETKPGENRVAITPDGVHELVIHGHDHRNLRNQLAGTKGPIPVYGAPSTTYTDERPDRRARYNVYTIAGGLLTGVESREIPHTA